MNSEPSLDSVANGRGIPLRSPDAAARRPYLCFAKGIALRCLREWPAVVDGAAHLLTLGLILTLIIGCSRPEQSKPSASTPNRVRPAALLLAPHQGTEPLDDEIRKVQQQIRDGKAAEQGLERLGWLFVSKARRSFDPGFYRLAEQCALELESRRPRCPEGWLLRGHVLQNLHRFREAEPLARQLTANRGLPFDFGLLSDVLMEQGRLEEAIEACQKMLDLRPELQSYARGAHLRWLRGDLPGAVDLMRLATVASSPRDPESAAWVYSRLALYQFQSGDPVAANQSCLAALDYLSNYPPALLMKGRLLLARGELADAVTVFGRAAELNPLPEYQWTLSEALRAAGKEEEAAGVEAELARRGPVADPRTCALYLATWGKDLDKALGLARAELTTRQDVFTHDTLAWALAAMGQTEEAWREDQLALAEGTRDARLSFHAAVIASKAGQPDMATRHLAAAQGMIQMLLPSEQLQLRRLANELAEIPTPPHRDLTENPARRTDHAAQQVPDLARANTAP